MINKFKYYKNKFLVAVKYSKYPKDFFNFFFNRTGSNFFLFKYKKYTFLIRNEDFVSLQEILEEGEYKIVNNFSPKKNYYVLDLGANIGLFSIYFLEIFNKAKILSVEASTDTFNLLKKTISLNPNYKWEALNKAVYNEKTTIFFQNSGSSTARKILGSDSAETKVSCDTVTVDELLANLIPAKSEDDYLVIKMDIEGAEEKVVLTNNDWVNKVDYLIIELHDNVDKEKMITFLKSQFTKCLNIGRGVSKKPLLLFTNL